MATSSNDPSSALPDLYLSPDQQELLLAALSSNNPNQPSHGISNTSVGQRPPSGPEPNQPTSNSMAASAIYESPKREGQDRSYYSGSGVEESPFLDYELDLDIDGSFDIDDSANYDGQMIGNLPGRSSSNDDGDMHEKRKSIDDEKADDGGGKRREGDEKTAKKPGRKPLTSEPTSKRKAQNRAAQRAFRDRKEKHLKDLELKVADLEKASESANHENGMLRAQVERMSTELKDYRKRMSTGAATTRSPTSATFVPPYVSQTANPFGQPNDFNFDFPRFGGLPGSHIFNNGSLANQNDGGETSSPYKTPGVVDSDPAQPSVSPGTGSSNQARDNVTSNGSLTSGVESLTGLFSPSILENVSKKSSVEFPFPTGGPSPVRNASAGSGHSSSSNVNGLQHYSGGSDTTSPSASSVSHKGSGSSCGTSPEPSSYSPITGKMTENPLNTINEEHDYRGETGGQNNGNFWASPQTAALNPFEQATNAIPQTAGQATLAKTPASEINGIDWLAQQNGGQFDPVLFGDYRESQDAVTSGDYETFFNEAFPLPDLSSPFNDNAALNLSPSNETAEKPEPALQKERFKLRDGADMPKMTRKEILDRIQCMEKLRNGGDVDIDLLCSDMKKKARCSEMGSVIDQDAVDHMLARLNEQAAATPPL